MKTLQQIKSLMEYASVKIEHELKNAPKINKSNHAKIRSTLGEIKKLVTSARAESVEMCKKQ